MITGVIESDINGDCLCVDMCAYVCSRHYQNGHCA